MVIFLILRQYIGARKHPAPIGVAVRTGKKNLRNIIGAQCLVSIAYWRRGTLVRQYSHRLTVRCASPIFIPIAYYLGFTNRKRKYFEEKTTATLKSKQTSIATVRNHLRTLARSPTPLIFHWSLPLKELCPKTDWLFGTYGSKCGGRCKNQVQHYHHRRPNL